MARTIFISMLIPWFFKSLNLQNSTTYPRVYFSLPGTKKRELRPCKVPATKQVKWQKWSNYLAKSGPAHGPISDTNMSLACLRKSLVGTTNSSTGCSCSVCTNPPASPAQSAGGILLIGSSPKFHPL